MSKRTPTSPTVYVEAAIVCIKLRDFMTYSQLEYYPGPRMNLIIGPNGAGKSTILCGICLGLGGTPSSVGRSGTVAQYIKHNRDKALIEIELFSPDTKNYVISREIHSNNQSVWMINAKPSNQKVVDQLMVKLNIQVKNLCQFLPQERVVEFVRMSNEELLQSTEKAADVNMWENHNKLKDWYKQTHNLEQTFARVNEELERENQRNADLEEQVKLYRTRKSHLEKIQSLKKKKAWMIYQQANDNYSNALEEEKQKTEELKNINSTINPLRSLLDNTVSELASVEGGMKDWASSITKLKENTSKLTRQFEDLTEKASEEIISYKAKQKEEEERIKRIDILRQQLQGLQKELSNVDQVDDVQINNELKDIQKNNSELIKKFNSIQADKDTAFNQKRDVERELNQVLAELKQQQDVQQSKMRMLNQKDRDAYEVANWINNNKDKFKKTVHGPILVTINVKDAYNAKYIERAVPFKDMVAFVCEDKSDMELLMSTAKQTLRKRINAVMAPTLHYTEYLPSVPLDSIRHFGFRCQLIDMIEAPDAVMAYLCQQYHIHSIPVGSEQTRLKVSDIISTTNLRHFYTENHQYTCTISKYGDHKTSTRSSVLHPARLLTINVNVAKIQELEHNLEQWRSVQSEVNERITELTAIENEVKTQLEGCRARIRELKIIKNQRDSIRAQIEQKESNIDSLQKRKIDLDEEKMKRNTKLLMLNNKKIILMNRHEKTCSDMISIVIKRVKLACKLRVLAQKKHKIQIQIQDKQGDILTLQREVECLKRRTSQLRESVRTLMKEAQTICEMTSTIIPSFLQQSFAVLPETIEDLDNEMYRLQSKADCMRVTNENSVDEYRESRVKMEELNKQKSRLEDELKNFGTNMDNVKNQWLTPLLELLNNVNKRFSYYLSTLGCAGEVGLKTAENDKDFSKYGISIKVKYRDGDPLRELTQFYQSGGERSVATVLYLLSLQEFVRLPFCCVDEINQGMDSTNERRVFQLMTRILCSETNSQYFLVTPKLLPDLDFHDNVQVNYIISGELSIKGKLNIGKLIERRLKQK
ncbi:Structural maintenance of chromosomes protein 5 [Chamberlinius hualienensis]